MSLIVNSNPYPIEIPAITNPEEPFTIPIPSGSDIISGTIYSYSPITNVATILAPNGSTQGASPGTVLTSASVSGINSGGQFLLSFTGTITNAFIVYIQFELIGTFPLPPGPTFPPWPGPPAWPAPPGWPGVPTVPTSGLPYPGWPGGPNWPGYPIWDGTYGGSGWQSWGSILTRVPQGDYIQSNRYRGSRESDKINSIAKSSETDAQTGLIKAEWLQYLCYNNNEAYYIAADYALRHLQHLRQQLEWRIGT